MFRYGSIRPDSFLIHQTDQVRLAQKRRRLRTSFVHLSNISSENTKIEEPRKGNSATRERDEISPSRLCTPVHLQLPVSVIFFACYLSRRPFLGGTTRDRPDSADYEYFPSFPSALQ